METTVNETLIDKKLHALALFISVFGSKAVPGVMRLFSNKELTSEEFYNKCIKKDGALLIQQLTELPINGLEKFYENNKAENRDRIEYLFYIINIIGNYNVGDIFSTADKFLVEMVSTMTIDDFHILENRYFATQNNTEHDTYTCNYKVMRIFNKYADYILANGGPLEKILKGGTFKDSAEIKFFNNMYEAIDTVSAIDYSLRSIVEKISDRVASVNDGIYTKCSPEEIAVYKVGIDPTNDNIKSFVEKYKVDLSGSKYIFLNNSITDDEKLEAIKNTFTKKALLLETLRSLHENYSTSTDPYAEFASVIDKCVIENPKIKDKFFPVTKDRIVHQTLSNLLYGSGNTARSVSFLKSYKSDNTDLKKSVVDFIDKYFDYIFDFNWLANFIGSERYISGSRSDMVHNQKALMQMLKFYAIKHAKKEDIFKKYIDGMNELLMPNVYRLKYDSSSKNTSFGGLQSLFLRFMDTDGKFTESRWNDNDAYMIKNSKSSVDELMRYMVSLGVPTDTESFIVYSKELLLTYYMRFDTGDSDNYMYYNIFTSDQNSYNADDYGQCYNYITRHGDYFAKYANAKHMFKTADCRETYSGVPSYNEMPSNYGCSYKSTGIIRAVKLLNSFYKDIHDYLKALFSAENLPEDDFKNVMSMIKYLLVNGFDVEYTDDMTVAELVSDVKGIDLSEVLSGYTAISMNNAILLLDIKNSNTGLVSDFTIPECTVLPLFTISDADGIKDVTTKISYYADKYPEDIRNMFVKYWSQGADNVKETDFADLALHMSNMLNSDRYRLTCHNNSDLEKYNADVFNFDGTRRMLIGRDNMLYWTGDCRKQRGNNSSPRYSAGETASDCSRNNKLITSMKRMYDDFLASVLMNSGLMTHEEYVNMTLSFNNIDDQITIMKNLG